MPASPHTCGSLRVVPCAELDAAQLRRLARIYAEAFPPDLRVPLAELAARSPAAQRLSPFYIRGPDAKLPSAKV